MTNITLEEYQDFVETMWIPSSNATEDELRIMMGLFGELGEIAEKIKKFYRDGGDPETFRKDLQLESGDAFFYFAKMHNFFDITLDDTCE
jgi:NTP pyrophosphatase (non-canonical NTP hydrolase)